MISQLETRLRSEDLFGYLQPEKEQVLDKKPEVKPNPNLELLVREYEEFIKEATDYEKAEELYERLTLDSEDLTSKNIEEFSILLKKYEELKNFYLSGFYLSRAINNSNDKKFTIHTAHLENLIDFLGYENNGKAITINGNAGGWIGDYMKNGKITIEGNAGDWVGSMEDGKITIEGNAGHFVGGLMQNGTITIKGNAGDFVGYEMGGGIITIKKNAGNRVGYLMENGKITIKGNAGY